MKGWAWEPGNSSYLVFAAIAYMASWSYASYACASYVLIRAILRGAVLWKTGYVRDKFKEILNSTYSTITCMLHLLSFWVKPWFRRLSYYENKTMWLELPAFFIFLVVHHKTAFLIIGARYLHVCALTRFLNSRAVWRREALVRIWIKRQS